MQTIKITNFWTGAVILETKAETLAAVVTQAIENDADLQGANLRGANLYGANLQGANLYGAGLQGANLRGANLYGANLRGANLRGANLQGADLYGANLRGANLQGANLYGAGLQGADLQGAYLQGANLYGAYLQGANLYGANLPAPTAMLLASWGEVSDALCRDLMTYDAACHPDPTAFDRWAKGGECPYSGVKVERAAVFQEKRVLWDATAPLCRPYDLMQRVLAEKCPAWTDAQHSTFEAAFKKVQP